MNRELPGVRSVAACFWAANVAVDLLPGFGVEHAFVRKMKHDVIVTLGRRLYASLVKQMRSSGAARSYLVESMRNQWWLIRMHRSVGSRALVSDAVFHVVCADFVLQDAGVLDDSRRRTWACLSHACCCEGCDLWNGARLGEPLPGDPRAGNKAACSDGPPSRSS